MSRKDIEGDISQWNNKPFSATSSGTLGNCDETMSDSSISFSSIKCSSRPPPCACLNGMYSGAWKPYRGWNRLTYVLVYKTNLRISGTRE